MTASRVAFLFTRRPSSKAPLHWLKADAPNFWVGGKADLHSVSPSRPWERLAVWSCDQVVQMGSDLGCRTSADGALRDFGHHEVGHGFRSQFSRIEVDDPVMVQVQRLKPSEALCLANVSRL